MSDEAPWPYFPVFLRLQAEPVLLLGGGEVAARKLRLLLRAQAQVRLVARALNEEVAALVAADRVRHLAAEFEPAQLDGCTLAVAASDDAGLNARFAAAARERRVPVNVVDDAAASSFVMPAIVDRSPLLLAIGSGGGAPVLARRLRERLEAQIPAAYGRLAAFMQTHRARVKTLEQSLRRGVWERFVDGAGAEALLRGNEAGALAELDAAIAQARPKGEVYLVGAGPGDPDLLTFRALRLMQQCDVVLYDRLVSDAIMELVRRDATRIFVGKSRNLHTVPQDEINAELVRQAQAGRRVLRLKGGDPFIFGRGGEEIETLMAHGVAFQVVPGVTAASGCAAYAGIPLTHRDYAQSCVFVTGHARKDGQLELHWDQLARRGQTVVFYMGLQTLGLICQQLIAHGLPGDWPAAVVIDGTTAQQQVIASTLAELPAQIDAGSIKRPALLMVGEVVRLRAKLAWFGARAP
ncbi:uroporphyrin-III C-methyltransferase / precorrin-2 dehydrogenase / sirohydrochlorin ferrochelatase [Solimonas aquatica]|uniref:Siroheme synthase n=1 Tax=Solimonas aquatica TaxID=489703 RepID=A0A1H9AN58_9GAMM|nr:siroheme synthase CysG [Solimonas aquatica]SEP78204.1 uroporphyrin-III C-methyltransferase / precorrin-2 dehydrogenase / sirohydrochlorin ferrochelatase [Solimonas aquatica]